MAEGPSETDATELALFEAVAARMKEARERKGLSRGDLAEKIGVKPAFIFELERGSANPTLRTLNRVAAALHIQPSELLPYSTRPEMMPQDAQALLKQCEALAGQVTCLTKIVLRLAPQTTQHSTPDLPEAPKEGLTQARRHSKPGKPKHIDS